jgi:peroxiredoxin
VAGKESKNEGFTAMSAIRKTVHIKKSHIGLLHTDLNVPAGKTDGVAMVDGPLRGLLVRSVVVVDEKGVVIHTELVPDIGQEPNYDAVETVLK